MRYKTVLLDADQTLLDFHRSERAALEAALRASGIDPTEEMIKTYSVINSNVWKRLEKGEISKIELRTVRFADLCRHFSLHIEVEKLANDYLEALSRQGFLLDGALALCQALYGKARLYIITNGIAAVQHGRLDHSPLRPYFEDVFISDELGAEKPHKAFFDEVRSRIPDFDPKTTLVVGDSLSSDMAGGIAAGLHTCWFNPSGAVAPADMPITYTVKRSEDIPPLVLGA